jgi:hypothetical protein
MFDRLQRPFLTVETGEAYQPIRLSYEVVKQEDLIKALSTLKCLEKSATGYSWTWYWKAECTDIHFESLDSFRKNPEHPVRLGTLTFRDNKLYFHFPSFKRACMAVPFFHKIINHDIVHPLHADFINKVFALDERLPHGFSELFKEEELDRILTQRVEDYHLVKEQCEKASTAEEAFAILSKYTTVEAKKKLPYAERYGFEQNMSDPEISFLSFYIFLRGRELVAIRRWLGQTGYTLSDAADETVEQVFGGMGLDIIE